MAESFVDTFKTELVADRLWRTRSQLELAIVEWIGWYNTARLHGQLGDIPPIEFEQNALAAAAEEARRGGGGLSLRSPYELAALDPAARTDTLLTVETK
jgi:putative transposase